jgi:lysozyme
MTLYGPDTSNNNFSSTADCLAFLNRLPSEGFSFIEQKVSEGNYYKDPFWSVVNQWATENNFPCIGYHYVTTNDPASQARTWLANNGGKFAMFDFEANSGDIANFWAVVNAFNAAGITVVLSYIPHWYWQQIGSPDLSKVPGLISSSYFGRGNYASVLYPGAQGAGWQPYGGATPQIWQFTDGALIAGLSVDCNAFEGTLDQLTALLEGTTVTQPDPVMAALNQIQAVVNDIQTQLRGPGLKGWPQLGQNAAGQDLTMVDAVAAIKTKVGA